MSNERREADPGQRDERGAPEHVEKRSGHYTEGQKGIINMPDAHVTINVQDMAPGDVPAPAQTAPADPPPPTPPASPEQ